jgi:hypothetical protein
MKNEALRESFRSALNSVSLENESNTPDFILVELLMDVLEAFTIAVNKRTKWYGDHSTIQGVLNVKHSDPG